MKKPLFLMLIPLLTIAGLYIAPTIIHPAHGTGITGEVCIASSTSTTCPITTPTITGPAPGLTSFFYARVLVNGSDVLSSFDITLLTNSSILVPKSVALGGVIANAHEIVKCIGGVNKLGSSPCAPNDTAGTIRYGVSGDITGKPVTGVLFTANFTVAANSARTPITFQTGCLNTSVPGGICVTITSGGIAPDPETAQTAKFSNQPYFELLPSTGTFQVSKGDTDLSGSLSVTSLNGFGGTAPATVNLGASVSPVVPSGPVLTILPNTVVVTTTADGLAALNVTVPKAAPPGTYFLNISATSAGSNCNGSCPPDSVTVQLIVPTPDFGITPSPKRLFFNVTVSGTSTITVSSIGNFNGTVTLSAQSKSPFLAVSLQNSTLHLASKGTNSTKLVVKASIYGVYNVTVSATSGSLSHSTSVTVDVVDYFLQVPSSVVNVVNGSSAVESITVNVPEVYNVTVTITNIHVDQVTTSGIVGPSTGLNVTCSPTTIQIVSKGATKGTGSTACLIQAVAIANYFVTVTAISGVQNRTSVHAVTFPVSVIAPNFSITTSATVTTVAVSASTSFNATIKGNLGLVDNVTVTLTFSGSSSSNLPTVNPKTYLTLLTTSSQTKTTLVTITTGSTTPPGQYVLTVSGTGLRSNPSTVTTTVVVIVVETASPHNLAVVSVSPSATSTTVGTDITFTIQVQNRGKLAENATVIALVSDQTVGALNETNIVPGETRPVMIIWHTTGFNPGAYVVGAKILAVAGQTNTTYNLLRVSTPVTLTAVSSGLPSYVVPLAIATGIIVVGIVAGLLLLSRRKMRPAQA